MWDCSKTKIMTLAETKKTPICLNCSNPGLTFNKKKSRKHKTCTFKNLTNVSLVMF